MGKLIICRGAPGSGKSFWATEQVRLGGGLVVRVNRDEIRSMLHADEGHGDGRRWSKGREKLTEEVRDAIIRVALRRNLQVICDDTNLSGKVVDHLRTIADEFGADLEFQDFTDVPLEECIRRDAARERTVGASVIRRIWSQAESS